jgi:hypothetical protein
MNQAKQLERSQNKPRIAESGGVLSKKRKSPEAAAQSSEEPLTKQLKTVKANVANRMKYVEIPSKAVEAPRSTTLSRKTMRKLDAFRFCEAQPGDVRDDSVETGREDDVKLPDHQDHDAENMATKSKYVMKDHSNRLVRSGKEEMAKNEQVERVKSYEETNYAKEDGKESIPTSRSRKRMKDQSSRLIRAGAEGSQKAQFSDTQSPGTAEVGLTTAPFTQYEITEPASSLNKTGEEELGIGEEHMSFKCSENCNDSNVAHNNYIEPDDTIANIDDWDDSIFDEPCMDDSVFDKATSANTTRVTEMDDLDDSIFEQFLTDANVGHQKAPSWAQSDINCTSSDRSRSPIKPGFMPTPKFLSSNSPEKTVSKLYDRDKADVAQMSMSPFIRPSAAVLVASPNPIPGLHASGRIITCFRLAEMIREMSSPSAPSTIELFATVKTSVRNQGSTIQFFTFADLFFPQRPPYVQGVYNRCTESELFDDDSRPFLKAGLEGRGMLAHVIVGTRLKLSKQLLQSQKSRFVANEETLNQMELEVLSIYECPWEDIEYTKGIVMPKKEAPIKVEGEQEVFYKPEKKRKFNPLKRLGHDAALRDISSNIPASPTRMGSRKI